MWHASIASDLEVTKNLKTVFNIGVEKNPSKEEKLDPAFLIGGLIYSLTSNVDTDFGVKTGLTRTETDLTFLAGTTLKF